MLYSLVQWLHLSILILTLWNLEAGGANMAWTGEGMACPLESPMTPIPWFQNAKVFKKYNQDKRSQKKAVLMLSSTTCFPPPPINSTNRCYLQGPQHICTDKAATHQVSWEGSDLHVNSLARTFSHILSRQHWNGRIQRNRTVVFGWILQVHLQSLCLGNTHVHILFKESTVGWRASLLPASLPFSSFHIWVLSRHHAVTNQNKGNMRNG